MVRGSRVGVIGEEGPIKTLRSQKLDQPLVVS
jgi:hypothetical protein